MDKTMDVTGLKRFVAIDARRRAVAFAGAALANGVVTADDPDYLAAMDGDRQAHIRLLHRVEDHEESCRAAARPRLDAFLEELAALCVKHQISLDAMTGQPGLDLLPDAPVTGELEIEDTDPRAIAIKIR